MLVNVDRVSRFVHRVKIEGGSVNIASLIQERGAPDPHGYPILKMQVPISHFNFNFTYGRALRASWMTGRDVGWLFGAFSDDA